MKNLKLNSSYNVIRFFREMQKLKMLKMGKLTQYVEILFIRLQLCFYQMVH